MRRTPCSDLAAICQRTPARTQARIQCSCHLFERVLHTANRPSNNHHEQHEDDDDHMESLITVLMMMANVMVMM